MFVIKCVRIMCTCVYIQLLGSCGNKKVYMNTLTQKYRSTYRDMCNLTYIRTYIMHT